MADTGGGNGPQRSTPSRLAGANTPMARTALLVVVAIIIGIVMINIVGDGGSTAKTTASTTTPPTTSGTTQTTAGTTGSTTTTTTKKTAAVIPPASLKLIVVNSGAPKGSGGNVLNALHAHGYTNSANNTVAVTWKQSGLTVHCKPGLDKEATALVAALKAARIPNYTPKAAAYKTEPGVPSTFHCYVAIGAAS